MSPLISFNWLHSQSRHVPQWLRNLLPQKREEMWQFWPQSRKLTVVVPKTRHEDEEGEAAAGKDSNDMCVL